MSEQLCLHCGEPYPADLHGRLTHDYHCGGSSAFTPEAADELARLEAFITDCIYFVKKAEASGVPGARQLLDRLFDHKSEWRAPGVRDWMGVRVKTGEGGK